MTPPAVARLESQSQSPTSIAPIFSGRQLSEAEFIRRQLREYGVADIWRKVYHVFDGGVSSRTDDELSDAYDQLILESVNRGERKTENLIQMPVYRRPQPTTAIPQPTHPRRNAKAFSQHSGTPRNATKTCFSCKTVVGAKLSTCPNCQRAFKKPKAP